MNGYVRRLQDAEDEACRNLYAGWPPSLADAKSATHHQKWSPRQGRGYDAWHAGHQRMGCGKLHSRDRRRHFVPLAPHQRTRRINSSSGPPGGSGSPPKRSRAL